MAKLIKIKTYQNSDNNEHEELINVDQITEVIEYEGMNNPFIKIFFGENRWTYANMSLNDFYKLIDNKYVR